MDSQSEKKARAYIAQLFSIVGTNSVLVIFPTGKVKRLYCPFEVICKVDAPPLERGKEYLVEAIKMTLKLEEVFIVEGRAYHIWCFSIKV